MALKKETVLSAQRTQRDSDKKKESAADRMKKIVEKRVRIKKRLAAEKKRKGGKLGRKLTTEEHNATQSLDEAVKGDTKDNETRQQIRADIKFGKEGAERRKKEAEEARIAREKKAKGLKFSVWQAATNLRKVKNDPRKN